ncbi:hypothetical protein NPIL_274781 [Nephila pilipes]|uniref:Uncharacterized protein n=1 Tax=Nephila pilipes TaxID=299642 RepID=A0A8X6PX34_NEPPI|nr:hypothetical protein NPIL_274781 [Nephila pilipes]
MFWASSRKDIRWIRSEEEFSNRSVSLLGEVVMAPGRYWSSNFAPDVVHGDQHTFKMRYLRTNRDDKRRF